MNECVERHSNENPRLHLFYWVCGSLFFILTLGLAWRQLIKSEDYLEQEEKQSLRRILQPGPRGEIYDRNGRLLVGNRPLFSIAVHLDQKEIRYAFRKEKFKLRRQMREAGIKGHRDELENQARTNVINRYLEPVNKILDRQLEANPKEVSKHFGQRLLLPFPVVKDISPEEYAQLTEQLPVEYPVQVILDSARYYPHGSLASHTLGYVGAADALPIKGIPGNHLRTFSIKGKTGKNGIEKSFNAHLEGETGGEIWVVDPAGFQYERIAKKNPTKGLSLTLSIDIDLQNAAEQALENKKGAVVALDVETGEVLALASKPDFDLNALTPYIPTKVYNAINARGGWLNRAIQGFYPPASPFKIITAIACLRHNVIEPDQIFCCENGFLVGNRIFPEHEYRTFGDTDLKKALKVSSNVYFYQNALELGQEKLTQEARRFQLHKATGIELPYEGKRMVVPDPIWKMNHRGESWRGGDTANMSIGQGFLLVTPLQMACFIASIARNETTTQPTLIHDPAHTRKNHGASPIGLSQENYQAIIDGLILAAKEGGGKYACVPGLSLAAKTGTGQILSHGKKGTVPWFLGFAPVENPKIALAVVIESTENVNLWGGSTAGPIAHIVLATFYKKQLKEDT